MGTFILIVLCAVIFVMFCMLNFMINPSAEFYGEKNAQRNFYIIRLSGPIGTLILLAGELIFVIGEWMTRRRDWKHWKSFYEWK